MAKRKVTAAQILDAMKPNEKVRVSDISSRLYLNKQTARRALNMMVKMGVLEMERYKYVGNADICVYRKI